MGVSVGVDLLHSKSGKCIGHIIGHAQRYQTILSIVINVDSEVFGTGRVAGDGVVLAEGGEEMFEVFDVFVFDSEIIHY